MSSKKKIKENKRRIISLLESTEREGIDGLVGWLSESDFFEAPASTRPDYHGAHEGGLAQHCLNVYDAFNAKAEQYSFDISQEEIIIASLMHDLCKVGTYHPNKLKSGNVSQSKPYVVEDSFPFGHGEKSAYLAARFIELTPKEALMIRWHMGPFDSEWENYENKVSSVCPEVYAFHTADQEASKYMDAKKK
jgi:hypothetical protein